jgi:small subunit ribosomal protein S15Ae
VIDDHRNNKIVVQLNGRINKTGVISPRFNVKLAQIDRWITLLLPARSFGFLVLVRAQTLSLF